MLARQQAGALHLRAIQSTIDGHGVAMLAHSVIVSRHILELRPLFASTRDTITVFVLFV